MDISENFILNSICSPSKHCALLHYSNWLWHQWYSTHLFTLCILQPSYNSATSVCPTHCKLAFLFLVFPSLMSLFSWVFYFHNNTPWAVISLCSSGTYIYIKKDIYLFPEWYKEHGAKTMTGKLWRTPGLLYCWCVPGDCQGYVPDPEYSQRGTSSWAAQLELGSSQHARFLSGYHAA